MASPEPAGRAGATDEGVTPGVAARFGAAFGVTRSAASNPVLRGLLGAAVLFEVAELTLWIAVLIDAYDHGGATASLIVALLQLVPSALLAPAIGVLADQRSPDRVLVAGYGLLTLTAGGLGAAVAAGSSLWVIDVLAPLTTLSLTAIRPAQAAVMPSVVHTADELTAGNVVGSWAESIANVGGPALAGGLITLDGPTLAVSVSAGIALVSTLLARVAVHRDPILVAARAGAQLRPAASSIAATRRTLHDIGLDVRRNLALVAHSRPLLVLLGLHGFYYVIVGAVELSSVVIAARLLHLANGGAGFLTATFGAGSVLAGAAMIALVGKARLAGAITASLIAAGAALALLGSFPNLGGAFVLLGAAGAAGWVFDVAGRALLQRAAPADSIGGGFAFLETLLDLGLAAGAVLARIGLAAGGPRTALLVLAALAALLALCSWHPLRTIDAAAVVPQTEIRLLRAIPIFAALPITALEGVARELAATRVSAGTAVIVEGGAGDRYYAIADGRFEVTRRGDHVATLSRDDGFGEVALLNDVPRTASVTALDDSLLYALDKASFELVLTGYATARRAAAEVAASRLPES